MALDEKYPQTTCPVCGKTADFEDIEEVFGWRNPSDGERCPQSYCRVCRNHHNQVRKLEKRFETFVNRCVEEGYHPRWFDEDPDVARVLAG